MTVRKRRRMRATKRRKRCKNGTRKNRQSRVCELAPVATATAPLSDTAENATYLKAICNDAHMCTTFGIEVPKIEQFFQFPTFKYVVGMRNLSNGTNGFINELIYERANYRANAILKTTLDARADNLYYEAYIGLKYINRLAQQFPCFLKTYGLFAYIAPLQNSFAHIRNIAREDPMTYAGIVEALSDGDILAPVDIMTADGGFNAAAACTNHTQYAYLLEYIAKSIDFYNFVDWQMDQNDTREQFFRVELAHILFQVYAVLGTLTGKRVFSHNDLHANNIVIYTIPNNACATLTYKNTIGGATVSFKTRYIAKIIDYGRVYCPEMRAMNDAVCAAPKCAPDCGRKTAGFYDIFDKYNENGDTFDPALDVTAAVNIYDRCVYPNMLDLRDHIYSYMARKLNPGEKFIYTQNNPLCYILSVSQKTLSDNYKVLKARDFDIFGDRKSELDWRNIPVIDTTEKLYWALFYYIHKSPIYAAAAAIEPVATASVGEIICNLDFNFDNIRPLVFAATTA